MAMVDEPLVFKPVSVYSYIPYHNEGVVKGFQLYQ